MNSEEPLFSSFEEDPAMDYELENEMLLLKLRAEFGGETAVFQPDDVEIPASLKYGFLQSVYRFEQNFSEHAMETSVFEVLELPYLLDEKYLTDEGIRSQLQRIRRLLQEKQLMLDTIYPTDDRVLYRFILEELLQEKVEGNLPPGFFRHFIYEEFHPNHRRDIEELAIQFFQHFTEQNFPSSNFYLSDEIVCGDILLSREEAVSRLALFAGLFASLQIAELKILQVELNELNASVSFRLRYHGVVSADESVEVDQEGKLGFIYRDGLLWQIDAFDIPGVVF